MSKLHEILAVESSLEKAAKKLRIETIKTLGKENLFKGHVKRLEMFSEEDKLSETEESKVLDTTVGENLNYLFPIIAKHWDTVLRKDLTNQVALADIVLQDGTVMASGLPATFLLGLETKLGDIRAMLEAIPTLAPGINWVKDELERTGIYKDSDETVTFKTKNDIEFRIASPATKEHAAQVVQLQNTKNVGKYVTNVTCGMVSPLEKAQKLQRLDEVLASVKKARMRANNVELVKHDKIALKILSYLDQG